MLLIIDAGVPLKPRSFASFLFNYNIVWTLEKQKNAKIRENPQTGRAPRVFGGLSGIFEFFW